MLLFNVFFISKLSYPTKDLGQIVLLLVCLICSLFLKQHVSAIFGRIQSINIIRSVLTLRVFILVGKRFLFKAESWKCIYLWTTDTSASRGATFSSGELAINPVTSRAWYAGGAPAATRVCGTYTLLGAMSENKYAKIYVNIKLECWF